MTRAAEFAGVVSLLLSATAMRCQTEAESPTVHAAFAARAERHGAPGIAWLCEKYLTQRPEWPSDLDAGQAFSLTWSPDGLVVHRANVPLATGVLAAGSCSFADGSQLLWICAHDGTEDWYVPRDFVLPLAWQNLLSSVAALALDAPRCLDLPVVVAHLAGATVDGDPLDGLRVGASACGEVTWIGWQTETHLRVRGRSGGGLSLPIALLHLARQHAGPLPPEIALRAFAARDGNRAEAARQLSRMDDSTSMATLQALLHAEDDVRLAAIDALVRRRACEELPRIITAAGPTMPWASLAAADALRELWSEAPPLARQRTRAAIARSTSITVRAFDLATLDRDSTANRSRTVGDDGAQARILLVLGLAAVGVYGFWARERARLRGTAD